MAELEQVRLLARVTGRVQGVGFRYNAASQARRLRLSGYVRNLPDGSVETVAEGPVAAIDRYANWLESGPQGARVESMESRRAAPTGSFRGFEIDG